MAGNPYNQPPTTLGKILHAVYGIDNRPYDTVEILWAKVARSLGINVSPDDELEVILSRIRDAGGAPPAPAPSAPSFIVTPSNVDPTPAVGLFAGYFHPGIPGITSVVVNHTTNTEGYDFYGAEDLESFTFPNLEVLTDEAYIFIDGCPKLTIVSAPKLTTTDGDITIGDDTIISSVLFPVLTSAGRFQIRNNPALLDLNFSALTNVIFSLEISNCGVQNINIPAFTSAGSLYPSAGGLFVINNNSLISLSLPAFANANESFQVADNPLLTTLSIPIFVFTNTLFSQVYDFHGNALLAASVNAILARAVANPAFTTGAIRLEGGTNAAPTGQGIADKATLIGRGVFVTTN